MVVAVTDRNLIRGTFLIQLYKTCWFLPALQFALTILLPKLQQFVKETPRSCILIQNIVLDHNHAC